MIIIKCVNMGVYRTVETSGIVFFSIFLYKVKWFGATIQPQKLIVINKFKASVVLETKIQLKLNHPCVQTWKKTKYFRMRILSFKNSRKTTGLPSKNVALKSKIEYLISQI